MPDELRRGFKSEAEDLAKLVRGELHLGVLDRLDCYVLAETWGIPIVTLGELREDGAKEESIKRLLAPAAGFSAATVCVGHRRLIVYNPRHSTGRIANSLAHELSHHILEHEPASAIGIGGCRHWNGTQEAEADWLAGALLIPRASALAWLRRSDDYDAGAQHFGVSLELFTWRANHTGAARQIGYARARQRRAAR
jgi:Zn-dependent peptidase ImmA (M78 family)